MPNPEVLQSIVIGLLVILLIVAIWKIQSLEKQNVFFHKEWSSAHGHRMIYSKALLDIIAGTADPSATAKKALEAVINEGDNAHS